MTHQVVFKAHSYTDLLTNMDYIRRTYKNARITNIVSHTEGRAFKETFLIVIVDYEHDLEYVEPDPVE